MIEERWTKSKISDIAKHLAIQESRNKDALVCRCTFHFGTSFRPATKDEIIKNTCKKAFTTPYRERGRVPAEAYHMGKWLGYTVELCFDGQWFNIDQWHRSASGRLRHRYLHAAPERDILSSPYDELALLKKADQLFGFGGFDAGHHLCGKSGIRAQLVWRVGFLHLGKSC